MSDDKAATRQVLLDLADRCEREEPSRALEIAIYTAVGAINEAHCNTWCNQNQRTDLTREMYISAWAPSYCVSLDAAVTLTDWLLICLSDIAADGMIQCELGEPGRNLVAVSVCAKTRALAVCAASLRARAEAL